MSTCASVDYSMILCLTIGVDICGLIWETKLPLKILYRLGVRMLLLAKKLTIMDAK